MNKIITNILSILVAFFVCQDVFADEGMWLINDINSALEKKMQSRGLKLSAHEIYNADVQGASLSDAIISLDFGCTGSLISDKGLIITNHHCAYCDVHALSTTKENFLENGFWANDFASERPIPNKNAFILKRVIDVTEEAHEIMENFRKGHCKGMRNRNMGQGECSLRKLSSILEKKWSKESGLEAWLCSMWKGSKYYIALYEVYNDVRLVAAPPVSSSAFGGDIDNWEWPQHKCDFAMYRIYTGPDGKPASYSNDNIPMKSPKHLKISTKGYKAGDFTMILGYPGTTNRFSGTSETDFIINHKLPICNKLRKEQMKIVNSWMNKDPEIRLKYSDYYFNLSNIQELQEGEVQCAHRFNVLELKEDRDEELQEWIQQDNLRQAKWNNLLETIETKYQKIAEIERNINYYRETLVRGTRFNRVIFKLNSLRDNVLRAHGITPKRRCELENGPDLNEEKACAEIKFKANSFDNLWKNLISQYEVFDLEVEKDLFDYALKEYYRNINPEYWGTWQKEIYKNFSTGNNHPHFNADAAVDWLWNNSYITNLDRIQKMGAEDHTINEWYKDPIYRFFNDIRITTFTQKRMEVEGLPTITKLEKEYVQALYQMNMDKGRAIYPDANSSLRITYGKVGGIEPWDGVIKHWQTNTQGILEKYNPNLYEFKLNDKQLELYRNKDWGRWADKDGHLYVNFMTDNDITGGNSGSPVLNGEGEIIGLAFDGNKESLASNLHCVDGYNKCICVDIRFVLWTLDKYAHMDRILKEIGF